VREAERRQGTVAEMLRTDRRSGRARLTESLADWTRSILIAFILFLVIRTSVVEAFKIPTSSMEGTLLVGDFLLVNKAIYGARIPGTDVLLPALAEPERGDVIVFHPPHELEKNYVKRVVGAPADTLHPTRDNWGPIVVPQGRFFVLGDNRDNSEDSRYWGFVTRDQIRGRPWMVYYSFEPSLDVPVSWLSKVRWARLGTVIR